MAELKVFVVEDESIVSKDIQQSLKKLGYNVVGSATSGEKALLGISDTDPDIILMDIMIKGDMNGIETAELVKEKFQTPVIFLTAYADEATLAKAKVSQPYGYILKPFKEVDLRTTIEMAIYKHNKESEVIKERDFLYELVKNKDEKSDRNFIFVKSNSKLVRIETAEIFYIEALKDYVVINTDTSRYTIHSTMKDIEQKMGDKEFIRVHRSYIVRLDKIKMIEFPNLVLDTIEKTIPVGGSYKEGLTKKIHQI